MQSQTVVVRPYDDSSIFLSRELFSVGEESVLEDGGDFPSLRWVLIPITATRFLLSREGKCTKDQPSSPCSEYGKGDRLSCIKLASLQGAEERSESTTGTASDAVLVKDITHLPIAYFSAYVRDWTRVYLEKLCEALDHLECGKALYNSESKDPTPRETASCSTDGGDDSDHDVDKVEPNVLNLNRIPHRFLVASGPSIWALECTGEGDLRLLDRAEYWLEEGSDEVEVEGSPRPLLGGTRGYQDGSFVEAKFHQPTALCWKLTEGTSLLERSCSVLFIADANCSIRMADFRTQTVRTIIGGVSPSRSLTDVARMPSRGYRDGHHSSAQTGCVTSMAYCKEGLLLADPDNAVIRIVTGVDYTVENTNDETGVTTTTTDALETDKEDKPSSSEKECSVWTVAGYPPTQGERTSFYRDDSCSARARFHTPVQIELVPTHGTEEASLWILDNSFRFSMANHAIRILCADGVRTVLGPLDYSGTDAPADNCVVQKCTVTGSSSTPPVLLYGSQLVPISLITPQCSPGAAEDSASFDVYYARSAFLLLNSKNGSLTIFLPVSEGFMETLMHEIRTRWDQTLPEAKEGIQFEQFFERELEQEELKLLSTGPSLHGMQVLSEPVTAPCVHGLTKKGNVSSDPLELDSESKEFKEQYLRMMLPWALPAPMVTLKDNIINHCHYRVSAPQSTVVEATASHDQRTSLLFQAFTPTVGRDTPENIVPSEATEEENSAKNGTAEPEKVPSGGGGDVDVGSSSLSSTAKPRKTNSAPHPHPHSGSELRRVLKPPEPSPPAVEGQGRQRTGSRSSTYTGRLNEMTEEDKKRLFLAKQIECASEETSSNVSLITEEERSELVDRYNQSRSCRSDSVGESDGVGHRKKSTEPGKRRNSSLRDNGGTTGALTPRSLATHLLLRPQRRHDSPKETNCTELKNGSVITPREAKHQEKMDQKKKEKALDVDVSQLFLRERYDCAVEDLHVVFSFFADKKREVKFPNGECTDGATCNDDTIHEEFSYHLSLISLWWILHNCNFLELVSVFTDAVRDSGGESEDCGGAAQLTKSKSSEGTRLLSFGVDDFRSMLSVVYERVGMSTFGYHVVSQLNFQVFRRIMLFFSLWELHVQQFLLSLEDRYAKNEAPVSQSMTYDRARIKELLCLYRADIMVGEEKKLQFGLIDDLPSLDALEEEQVIFHYRRVFDRCEENHNKKNLFTHSPIYQQHHPLKSYRTAGRDGVPRKELFPTGDPYTPSPASEEKLAGISPIEPVTNSEYSRPATPPEAPTVSSTELLFALLKRNEKVFRTLFDAFSEPTTVRRSAHYSIPDAARPVPIQSSCSNPPEVAPDLAPPSMGGPPRKSMKNVHRGKEGKGGTTLSPQDVAWKIRQALSHSTQETVSIQKKVSDTYPIIRFSNFQILFKVFDVYPSLVSDGLLSRAYMDALCHPLMVSAVSSKPSRTPTRAENTTLSLPTRDHSGLLFVQFVEAFIRVAMTVFSASSDKSVSEGPVRFLNTSASDKTASLMKWFNQQVQLGLLEERIQSVSSHSTWSGDRFPRKMNLFRTDLK